MSDGIVLVGLPGSGKTEVGRLVAAKLGRPFVDIDCEVERLAGSSPAELIARDGESRMREVERDAVAAATRAPGAVIATGGGTVLDPLNRWLLTEQGTRVRLDAPIHQLAARLRADATARPLLGSDLEHGLRQTRDSRAAVYAAVDAAVDAAGNLEQTAALVIDAATARTTSGWRPLLDAPVLRHHPMGPPVGRVLMGRHLDPHVLSQSLRQLVTGSPAVVADRAALRANPKLASALPRDRLCVADGGEKAKTIRHLEELLTWLAAMNIERADPLVVVGGGTIGDVGGLAAALHRRGVPLVNVPTTWLAQADSAIGGKVAIDLPNAKNGVGAFWPPVLVVEDASVIDSLPVDRRRDGIAECLKAGLIGDPVLWRLVEERGSVALHGDDRAAAYAITERAVRVKLEIVDRDPFEAGERRKLNLGHTIGHALEVESGYTLAHGTAVALGLRVVARIAKGRGGEPALVDRIDAVLAELGFPLRHSFARAAVVGALGSDKKRERGALRWILPLDVGHVVEVSDVNGGEVQAALDSIAA